MIRQTLALMLLPLLLVCAKGDTNVVFTCIQCGSMACLNVNGGPLDGSYNYPTQRSSCASIGIFPATYDFQCNGSCSDCQITYTEGTQTNPPFCSQSSAGTIIIQLLNIYYSVQESNPNLDSTYDWCGCGSGLSGGAIAGIVVGCVVGAALIGVAIWYCCFRKKSFEDYAIVK